MIWAFFLLLLLVAVVAALPMWPYSRRWGYYPAGAVFALILLLFALVWLGAIVLWLPWAT